MSTSSEFLSIVQVPFDDCKAKVSSVFISVIDASGSMRPFWPAVAKLFNEYTPKSGAHTITFSGSPSICKSNILSDNISAHGGGLTNIPAAFKKLDGILSRYSINTPVTILFVSDGQDNNQRTLAQRLKSLAGHKNKKITFLCLGIQSAFPTFLSMTLRELYHNTQSSIPALFLIEYFTEAALKNKFEAMKEYFYQKKKLSINPPLKEFPWSFEESTELYEGTWLIVTDSDVDSPIIKIGENEINLLNEKPTLDKVLDVFRAYVQEMQMLSLNKSEILIEQAGEALRVMQSILDYFKETNNIDLLKEYKLIGTLNTSEVNEEVEHLMKLDFHQRVEFNKLRHNQFRIKSYFENIELLAKGLGVQQLNEWEAAKRIGIGTITGNYHQKALNLNGLTVDAFKILRNEFIEIYKSVNFSKLPSKQEESVITLENQKDVFIDPEFVKGLQSCLSQFDLVETFPVVGLALNIKRPNGIDVDPWLVDVRSIAKHNRQMDSFSLLKSDFRMELSSGGNETEVINAVLPLFTLNDGDMSPLLSHDLFNLLMTFVLQRNVDTLDHFAYLALLGNTWIYNLSQEKSEYRDNMMKSIQETIQLVYGNNEKCKIFKQSLMKTPQSIFFNSKSAADLSKILTFTLLLFYSNTLEESRASLLVSLLFIRFFRETKEDWKILVQMDSMSIDDLTEKAVKQCEDKLSQYNTLGDLSRSFSTLCKKYFGENSSLTDSPLVFKKSKFDNSRDKITLKTLISIHNIIKGQDPSEDDLLHFLYLSSCSASDIMSNVSRDPTISIKTMKSILLETPDLIYQAKEAEALQQLKLKFIQQFQDSHTQIVPMSPNDIINHCKERNIDPSKLQYDNKNNMVRNACMAINCPYFLKPSDDLSKHLATWQEKCPRAFHKLIKENYSLEPKVLLSMLLEGKAQTYPHVKQKLSQLQPSSKNYALEYIKLVSEAYKNIDKSSSDLGPLCEYKPVRRQRNRKRNTKYSKRR